MHLIDCLQGIFERHMIDKVTYKQWVYNDRATLEMIGDYVVESNNFVAISESLKHDTIAVHFFQRNLMSFPKEEVGEISKTVYFSDGASSQYKNKKNFINLCYLKEDFVITAEWHFFATSHGKGPCDGIFGLLRQVF
ncbi:hypothetical protein J437_LFUL004910 [Ladona fulva]|uniref:Uncharacterized protein n=1 Tax=Ladona fulva TaxID=123851 RepID=A0A8K0P3C4_LADFU|nr:hypothetical protein J437_LFUL004910 [Ladona fulva]